MWASYARRMISVCIAAACLAGCALPDFALPAEKRIVVVWHTFIGDDASAFQTLIDRFNADNTSNIVVISEYQDDVLRKLQENSAPSSRPDIITLVSQELPAYMAAGLVGASPYELGDIARRSYDILPMATALYTSGGTLQALPLGLATYILYANTDWTGDLGYRVDTATWTDLRRTACAATDPVGGQIGLGIPAQASMFLAFLTAGGGPIITGDGTYAFASDQGYSAAALLHEMLSGGCGLVYGDWTLGSTRLSKSSMAMIVDSSKQLPAIEGEVEAGRNFQMSVSALPGPGGPGSTLWYGPAMMVIAPEGRRTSDSLQVLGYFFSEESQSYWAQATDYLPIRRSLLAEAARVEIPTLQTQLAQIALRAADASVWVVWPPYTDQITCRSSLLRALLAMSNPETLPAQYVDTAVTACNTAVRFPAWANTAPQGSTVP